MAALSPNDITVDGTLHRPIRGWNEVVPVFMRLRWTLLRANLKGPASMAWGTGLALLSAAVVGGFGGMALWMVGRTSTHADHVAVVAMAALAVTVAVLGLAAGVAQAIDPRVISTEPLRSRDASLGQLVLVASGPAGLAATGLTFGLLGGWTRQPSGLVIVWPTLIAWMITMLLVSRGATALLGLLAVRHPRAGQLVAGFTVLGAYVASQFLPRVAGDLGADGLARMAGWAQWTPPGQLGLALAKNTSDPAVAVAHLWLGVLWLPALGWVTYRAMHRLRTSQPRMSEANSGQGAGWRALRRLCRPGPVGAIAYRSVLVRVRTPREILQTIIGGAIGIGVVVGTVFLADGGESSVVLIGGAIQLTILITAGNTFGVDGPALASELLALGDGRTMALGKGRSTLILASPMMLVPLIPAAATGAWYLLPAGFLVAGGALLAGTGGAVAQSVYTPIALPETDNPFASGDTGRGCLVGVLTMLSLLIQAILAVPVALVLYLYFVELNTWWITAIAAVSIPFGYGVYRLGIGLAARRIKRVGPELLAEVTPSR